jgi:membrane protease YdiL (CAAX protease family)
MLSAKPWKPDAILRLLLSVFICIFAGALLSSLWHRPGGAGTSVAKLILPLGAFSLCCLGAALVLLNKPWRLETFEHRLIAVLVCFCAGLFAGAWVERLAGTRATDASIGRMLIATLSFQGAGLVFMVRFLREHQVTWAEGFGFRNQWSRAVLLGILVALIFLPVGWGLQQACGQLMTHLPHFKLQPEEQPAVHALRVAASWWNRLALGATAIMLAPVAEEMLFRGILYPAIKQAGFPHLALWGTALLFAAVHTNIVTFVPLMVLALALTALYERTNNLLAPIAAHAMFNALNFGSLLLQEYWAL